MAFFHPQPWLCHLLLDLGTWNPVEEMGINALLFGFAQKTWLAMGFIVAGLDTSRDPFQTHLFCVSKIRSKWRTIQVIKVINDMVYYPLIIPLSAFHSSMLGPCHWIAHVHPCLKISVK